MSYGFRYGDRCITSETTSGLRRFKIVPLLCNSVDNMLYRFIEKLLSILYVGRFYLKDSVTISDICPVLKHGPRSLTCARVCELEIYRRNESDRYDSKDAVMTDLDPR